MTSKLFVFIFLFLSINAFGQESRIDSLLNALDNSETFDEGYVDIANEISFEFLKSNPLNSPYYINLAISIAKSINYEQGLIRATTNKGSSYWVNGLHDEALSYYLLALSYDSEGSPLELVRLNNNIGEVFKKKRLFDSARKYYTNALRIVKKSLPERSPAILSSNIGEVFLMQSQIDSAEYYYNQCFKNSQSEGNNRGLAYAYYGLAEIAFHKFDIDKANALQNKSLELRIEIGDIRGMIQSYHDLGVYKIHEDYPEKALDYWRMAEDLAISFRALDLLNEIYLTKSQFFYRRGQFKEAADYIRSYKLLSDSVKSEEFGSSLNRTKAALLAEISDAENKLLKQQKLQEKEETRITLLYVIALSISIVSGLIILRHYRNKKKYLKEISREGQINESLLSLSKEVNVRQSGYDDFINKFLIDTSSVLQVHRASYWYKDEKTENIQCYRLLRKGEIVETSQVFTKNSSPKFFEKLVSERFIAVSDAKNDSRCNEFYESYLKHQKVNSFLMSPLSLNDKYIGFISYSMENENRKWSFSDQRYVGSLADILVSAFANNQNRQLEVEKGELIHKLIKKNKSLKEFNSVISHNLREPLTQVIGFTTLLNNQKLTSGETKEIVTRLSHSSDRIDSVIKDLSTILNEQDPVQKDLKLFSLTTIFNEVKEALSKEIERVNPIIKNDLSIKRINSYKPFLFDIIYHLLSNSLKFNNPENQLEVTFSSEENDKDFVIKISDNGRGIDLKSFKTRIFKMYMRHHHDVDGRGIGLYLVKNRVESLGGKIEVESKVMKGSTFTISLPKTGIR